MTVRCDYCSQPFGSWQARDQHMCEAGHTWEHYRCDTCPCSFISAEASHQHMDRYSHWTVNKCTLCPMRFTTLEKKTRHEMENHFWCSKCQRAFKSLNNINMHLRSYVHLGSTIECPCCPKTFTTATGVSHHLETGSCPEAPNINRDQIYKFMCSQDPDNIITNNLVDWKGSPAYQATSQSFNGRYFECYLCHRSFKLLRQLNQHLRAPIHTEKLYHCPNVTCRQQFVSLGGIFNHLESESCEFMRFREVETKFQTSVGTKRMIGF
ncbi:hypothetical protein GGS20DRAFT_533663 [Poronia punctata]|nr:hypothetical protein GGS20DRAFT_533663 [Poronia punctata]